MVTCLIQCTPDILATFKVAIRIEWPLSLVVVQNICILSYSGRIYSGQSDNVARKEWPKVGTISGNYQGNRTSGTIPCSFIVMLMSSDALLTTLSQMCINHPHQVKESINIFLTELH